MTDAIEPVITRSLALHGPTRRAPKAMLDRLQAWWPDGLGEDAVDVLERRIAELLGKEAALFFPTGKMAQQVALRIHCDRRGRPTWTGHPLNHLRQWGLDGHAVVHGLRYHVIGDINRLLTPADFASVREPLGAAVWELPEREIGGQCPPWEDLVAGVAGVRAAGAAAHLDGARLWEAQPFYDRPHAEIAGLFDTVYVSLYKGLEAPRGAVLAGDRDIIDEAGSWSQRLGGTIPDAWPLAAFALMGLDQLVPRMAAFRDHAVAIAEALNAGGIARTVPRVPQSPVFHVLLPVNPDAATAARDRLIAERGIQLVYGVRTDIDPERCRMELSIGENAMEFEPDEVAGLFADLVADARSRGTD